MFFKVDITGEDSTMEPMHYYQLMELLPNARYNISREKVQEVCKKYCIPPEANPKKYVEIDIQYYIDIPSGLHVLYLLILAYLCFLKRWAFHSI